MFITHLNSNTSNRCTSTLQPVDLINVPIRCLYFIKCFVVCLYLEKNCLLLGLIQHDIKVIGELDSGGVLLVSPLVDLDPDVLVLCLLSIPVSVEHLIDDIPVLDLVLKILCKV